MSESAVGFLDELPSRFDDIRVPADGIDERLDLFEAVQEFGVLLCEPEELPALFGLRFLDFVDSPVFERLVAPHTEALGARSVLLAARAGDCSDWVGFVLGDVFAVRLRDRTVAGLGEDGDIPGRLLAAPDPTVVVLEDGLVDAAACQEARTRFAKVGECDWLLDIGVVGSLPRDLPSHLVADFLAAAEFAPERRGTLAPTWMIVQPAGEMRDRRHERDRALALFTIHGDLEAVLVVGHITDAELQELAGASPSVEGDGDECGVTAVHRGVDHRLDVILPVEHLGRVRRRVVTPARSSGDPVETLGYVVIGGRHVDDSTLDDTLPEHPERDAVILVRLRSLLGVVLAVDPADDLLGSVSVLEGGDEIAVWSLGDLDDVPEQLFSALLGVLRGEQRHPVVEGQQNLGLTVGDVALLRIDLVAKAFQLAIWVDDHTPYSSDWELNLGCMSRLGRSNFGLHPTFITPPDASPSGDFAATLTEVSV